MPQQTINLGSAPDAGDGDTLRDGGDKINDNFTELYTDKLNKSGGTMTGDLIVPDEAYDATAWNGSLEVPTKNAVRDKIESLGASGLTVEDEGVSEGTGLTTLNFTGSGVSVTVAGAEAEVIIPGGISTFALGDATDVDTSGQASGHFLTYDGAQWEPGFPGARLIQTVSLSAVNNTSISSFAALGLGRVMFAISITTNTDDATLVMRYILNGGEKTDANYRNVAVAQGSAGTDSQEDSALVTTIRLTDLTANFGIGNASGECYSGTVTINNPDSTTGRKMARIAAEYYGPTGIVIMFDGAGSYEGTDHLDGLEGVTFALSGGVATMTGSIKVYGFA